MSLSDLSRRTFLIAGAASAAIAWLNLRASAPAAAAVSEAAPAAAVEAPHRTLLGVL